MLILSVVNLVLGSMVNLAEQGLAGRRGPVPTSVRRHAAPAPLGGSRVFDYRNWLTWEISVTHDKFKEDPTSTTEVFRAITARNSTLLPAVRSGSPRAVSPTPTPAPPPPPSTTSTSTSSAAKSSPTASPALAPPNASSYSAKDASSNPVRTPSSSTQTAGSTRNYTNCRKDGSAENRRSRFRTRVRNGPMKWAMDGQFRDSVVTPFHRRPTSVPILAGHRDEMAQQGSRERIRSVCAACSPWRRTEPAHTAVAPCGRRSDNTTCAPCGWS